MITTPTVVVLRALGLGDFLTGVPAYRAIARAFPDHRRILAVPRPFHPLLELLGGAFAEAQDVAPLESLPQSLRGADVAVDLHGNGPQSHAILLATEPRRFIAFAHADVPESADGAAWDPAEHEVSRWCRLLACAGVPSDPTDLSLALPKVAVPARHRGATLLHPGAASAARRWPAERFAEVARGCIRRGERVLFTGSRSERPLASEVARLAGLPESSVVAGETDVLALAALVAAAHRVVCGDTGIAHLASAYAVPSVVLFGPTPPQSWGPPHHERHRVLWAGRSGDPHADRTDAGLLTITPAGVSAELDALDAL